MGEDKRDFQILRTFNFILLFLLFVMWFFPDYSKVALFYSLLVVSGFLLIFSIFDPGKYKSIFIKTFGILSILFVLIVFVFGKIDWFTDLKMISFYVAVITILSFMMEKTWKSMR